MGAGANGREAEINGYKRPKSALLYGRNGFKSRRPPLFLPCPHVRRIALGNNR
jgi:hypothetical protein